VDDEADARELIRLVLEECHAESLPHPLRGTQST